VSPSTVVPLEQTSERRAAATLRAVRKCLRAAASAGLGGEALCTYAALLMFIDDKCQCWPSQQTLCEITRYSRRSLRRGLAALEKERLLRRVPRWREDGARESDLYTLGRGDAPGVGASGGRDDAPVIGETQKRKTPVLNLEGDAPGNRNGRSAPLCSPGGASSPPGITDPAAYAEATKTNKRQSWLLALNAWISSKLRGSDRVAAWSAIAEAQAKGSRAAISPEARQLLDRLDKERRREGGGGIRSRNVAPD
jgi:hypothetical protein